MKKYIKISVVITSFLILVLSSCDSQLEDIPKNQYSEIQVFSTEEGVETAVNGIYAQMQGYDYHGARMRLLLWPHSGKYQSKQVANNDANQLDITNTNLNLNALWVGMWKTINQANLVIKNVEGSGLKNEASSLGQAHFLRAVVYFDLARLFGEVPIRIIPTTKEDIHIAKSSKEEVYNLVIEDLKKAATLLPNRGEYINGRPLKFAANAYLAKVYLTLAGENAAAIQPANFNPVTESEITVATISNFWEEAKKELNEVITNGGYDLTPTYGDLWKNGTESRNTVESIFELQYGNTGAVRTNDIIRDVVLINHPIVAAGTSTFGRIRPNKEMFSDHIIQYSGLSFNGPFIPAGNANAILNLDATIADPRINETYIYNNYAKTTSGANVNLYPRLNRGNNAYAHLNKYKDLNYNGTTTVKNLILMRFADILLLMAEVENEINGPSTAYQYVNRVLTRARNTTTGTTIQPANWTSTSVPDSNTFRERILKEREYELNGEGHEWFDLRRRGLGRFQEQMNHHNNAVTFYNSSGNADFLYQNVDTEMTLPIPLSELSANNLINN